MIRGRPNPRHLTIARRLRLAREAADIKSVPLSLAAGLSIDTCLRIEDQGRVPGVDTLERLARVLRVSPGWLAFAPLRAPLEPATPIEEGAPLLSAGLGSRLRGLREERSLTVRALADRADLAVGSISMIESGRTMPGVDTAEALARGLGVSPAWLAYGEGPRVLPRPPRRSAKS
jgi:transcriptional regulator with XRE-family HTH domain